ncbi:MAG: Hpt domain-containing protein [Gammaproteobacteria bacterium]|nr:Hpt domain-containing protein [Gammaproteobacteria bacterium]
MDINEKLAQLQSTFLNGLPSKISEIEELWAGIATNQHQDHHLKVLHKLTHDLAGTGASFGASQISEISKKIEEEVESLMLNEQSVSPHIIKTINPLITELKLSTQELKTSE